MLQLGFANLIGVLSWIVVVALGLKVMATGLVLLVDKGARDRPGWGTILWWVTKTTPAIIAPCLVWIALLEHDQRLVWLFLVFGLFVAIAVPLAIRQRHRRMMAARPL